MTSMTCPHCEATLTVTVALASPGRAGTAHRPPDEPTMAAVRDFARHLRGVHTSAQLRAMYDDVRVERGWPALSDKALGRALKALGATPTRTSSERGWRL